MTWKQISDHKKYEVSSEGSVRRIGKMHYLSPWKHKSGHLYVRLDGKSRQVHHLVLGAFGDCRKTGLECLHKDGNPQNNNISNLHWGTRAQNIEDYRHHHGKHYRASIPIETAMEIRSQLTGKWGEQTRLAQKYNVSVFVVNDIALNKTYL